MIDVDGLTLSPGTHVLAAQVHNVNLTSSDLSFSAELEASPFVVTEVVPAFGPPEGGNEVHIAGIGFNVKETPVVRFDGTVRGKARAAALERISEGGRLLVMTTPESLASDELLVALFKSGISLFVSKSNIPAIRQRIIMKAPLLFMNINSSIIYYL